MGLFGSLLGMAGGVVGEQLWPVYERICRSGYFSTELQEHIENEERGTRKAIYLLALSRKDPSLAREIYDERRTLYDNNFRNLSNYYRFKREIEEFYRRISF